VPFVAAVDPIRRLAAGGAVGRGLAGCGDDGDAVWFGQDLLDGEPAGDQRENAFGHVGIKAAWGCSPFVPTVALHTTGITPKARRRKPGNRADFEPVQVELREGR
jgi:hypothetical protein